MSGEPPAATAWRVVARKTRGASHVRAGLENQDSIGWLPENGTGSGVAVSVADGHGSPISIRSSVGSRLAVEVSHELAVELLDFAPRGTDRSTAKRQLEEHGGRQVVRRWRQRVDADLAARPFTREEMAAAEERAGPGARDRLERDSHVAYGSTLLTAVATGSFMAFWQIGDGDIVVVDARGESYRPLDDEPEALGNATPSLCSADAWQFFRSAFAGTPAPLVLMSTDGLANSYESDEAFLAFAPDIMRRITADGLDAVADRLEDWLTAISAGGSGDDMALGILYQEGARPDGAAPVPPNRM